MDVRYPPRKIDVIYGDRLKPEQKWALERLFEDYYQWLAKKCPLKFYYHERKKELAWARYINFLGYEEAARESARLALQHHRTYRRVFKQRKGQKEALHHRRESLRAAKESRARGDMEDARESMLNAFKWHRLYREIKRNLDNKPPRKKPAKKRKPTSPPPAKPRKKRSPKK